MAATDLLEEAIDAHGGMDRWRSARELRVRLRLQGAGVPPFAHDVREHELLLSRVIAPFIEQVGDPACRDWS